MRYPSRASESVRERSIQLQIDLGEIGFHCLLLAAIRSCHSESVWTASLCTWTKPCTPAGFSASIWSLGLPATSTGTDGLRAHFAGQGQVFGVGAAEHDQVRIGAGQLLGFGDVEARAAEEVQAEVGARPAHFEVAALEQQDLGIAAGLAGDLRGARADFLERLGQAPAEVRGGRLEFGSFLGTDSDSC